MRLSTILYFAIMFSIFNYVFEKLYGDMGTWFDLGLFGIVIITLCILNQLKIISIHCRKGEIK